MTPDAATRRRRATAQAIALGWALLTACVMAATAPAQGIGRDEGVYLLAGESYAAFWGAALRAPGRALDLADRHFAVNHEHPPLAKELYGAAHAWLAEGLHWTGHLQGFRWGAFAVAALLSWLLATGGFALAGLGGALLAPALLWAAPRHFYHGHPAALDLPIAALWLATVLAYRWSLAGSRRWAVATGFAFGAALATKHNAWFLPPLLALHWAVSRFALLRRASWRERLAAVPAAFPAMAVLGPAVLLASWPWLWRAPWPRFREYVQFHLQHENYSWQYFGRLLREPPFPIEYPFVVTAVTLPAAVAFVYACGFAHGAVRLARAVRRHPGASASDELLLLLNALFPMALIAWPTVPHFGGVKHWLPAMPFLALLGARALVAAGQALSTSRPAMVTAGLAAAALAPGAWAVAHFHPYGTAAYGEVIGGAPGAATLGLQRQFWGDDVVGALAELNRHAAPGARVWWQETASLAVRAWQRDGRVRPDLRWADGPDDADLSIWHYHQEFKDKEYLTWTAFGAPLGAGSPERHVRPVAGVYLDEVPLVQIYARAGAWR